MTSSKLILPRQKPLGLLIWFMPYITSGLILFILPILLPNYLQGMMTKFLIYAIFAMSLDLIFGYAGLSSLGHAAYFGAGGYTVAVLIYHYGINSFWIGAPLGVLVAVLMAAVFGTIALRVSDIYFLLITFALGQLLYSVVWNIKWFNTPGVQGIIGLPRPDLGLPGFIWSTSYFYYFTALFFVSSYFVISRVTRSPFGRALVGIREGEARMRSLGYSVWIYRYTAFVLAGAFAGLAGVLFVYHNRFIAPAQVGIGTSFLAMCMVIIGGRGTMFGPVVGAAVVVFAEYYSSILTPQRWPLILGSIFVLSIMFMRSGIGVHFAAIWKKVSAHYGSVTG